MEFKITDNMRRPREDIDAQLASIKFDLFNQKYGRIPTAYEFFFLEDDIESTATHIFNHLFGHLGVSA